MKAAKDELEKGADGRLDFFWNPRKRQLQKLIGDLQSQADAEDLNAWGEAERNRIQQAGIKAAEAVAKANDQARTKLEQMNAELGAYRKNIEAIRKADPNSALLKPEEIA